MSSNLPTEDSSDKTVNQFGIGPYDSLSDNDNYDNDPKEKNPKKSLPDNGGPQDPFGPDRLLSYPGVFSSSILPSDCDTPPTGRKRVQETLQSVVHSVSQSQLPSDGNNPSARSDYYDRMKQGLERAPDPLSSTLWADEDAGAYASTPSPMKNDFKQDNTLQSTGNYWSGYTIEDTTNPEGFPSTDYLENVDFPRSDLDGGGKIMASVTQRVSTSIKLVSDIATEVLGKFKKEAKDGTLTRRHIMSFLQEGKYSQYLASDVIRCLKFSHDVYVKDVLDEFPAKLDLPKKVSLSSTRDKLIDMEINNPDVKTSYELRRCASSLSDAIAMIDRLGVSDG